MFKDVYNDVWAFDLEWVPDPKAGRLLYGLPDDMPDLEVVGEMWARNGATEENPMPYLKTVMCRVVSIAAVQRRVRNGEIDLKLLWLPRSTDPEEQQTETSIIGRFLQAAGKYRPQLVGFNSANADLKILIQRAVVLGVEAASFCARPDKPWEGPDYFARSSDAHVDMMDILGGWSRNNSVSLNDIATLSGIPGKMDTSGQDVASMWLAGKQQDIVQYNCYDALTTYLVWLRMAHFGGHFSHDQYHEEQERVRELIMTLGESEENAYLEAYFEEWERLLHATGQYA